MIFCLLSFVALVGGALFLVVCGPAIRTAHHQAFKELVMSLTDTATAVGAAATSINTAAAALSDAATKLGTLNDTTVLDQPVADLNSAVSSLTDAAAKITALASAA